MNYRVRRHSMAWRAARLATLCCGLAAAGALAQAPSPAPNAAATAPAGIAPAAPSAGLPSAPAPVTWTKATTVFVNTVIRSRTGGSARRLNESHAEMEAKGWRFLDLEAYTENGDLVGFFVTYVK